MTGKLAVPVAEAAKMLSVGKTKMYQLIDDGHIAVIKIGSSESNQAKRQWRVAVKEIERFAADGGIQEHSSTGDGSSTDPDTTSKQVEPIRLLASSNA